MIHAYSEYCFMAVFVVYTWRLGQAAWSLEGQSWAAMHYLPKLMHAAVVHKFLRQMFFAQIDCNFIT